MDNDYISRTESLGLIEAFFCSRCPDFLRCNHACEIADLMLEFEKLPGENLRQNGKARWINPQVSVTGASTAECSNCGAVVHDNFCANINYCPNCGFANGGDAHE